jgi:hypothetical protein
VCRQVQWPLASARVRSRLRPLAFSVERVRTKSARGDVTKSAVDRAPVAGDGEARRTDDFRDWDRVPFYSQAPAPYAKTREQTQIRAGTRAGAGKHCQSYRHRRPTCQVVVVARSSSYRAGTRRVLADGGRCGCRCDRPGPIRPDPTRLFQGPAVRADGRNGLGP